MGLLMLLRVLVTCLRLLLGSFFSWILSAEEFHSAEAAARMPDVPYVWADGSLVLDEVTGISSSSSVFFLLLDSLVSAGVLEGGVMLIILVLMVVKGSLG